MPFKFLKTAGIGREEIGRNIKENEYLPLGQRSIYLKGERII